MTLVEKQYLGGTCLNVGCIPTKCLLHSAELLAELKGRGSSLGIAAENIHVDFPQVMANRFAVSEKLTNGIAGLLKGNGIRRLEGEASFTAPGTMTITHADGTQEAVSADKIILATGSVNAVPPIPGLKENPNCIDSTGALSLEKLPESMVVIGGGVIGLELACAYAAFGTAVTVVEALDHILPMLDSDLTAAGMKRMRKLGIKLHTECPVQSVGACDAGAKVVCTV